MKKLFCGLMLLCFAAFIPMKATAAEVEARPKGICKFNCCKGWHGRCACFIAEGEEGSDVYTVPPLTTVFYEAYYTGPYLSGTYMDADGRMRVDNVVVTISPSDCIDPDTGALIEGCTVGVDEDTKFSNVGSVSVTPGDVGVTPGGDGVTP